MAKTHIDIFHGQLTQVEVDTALPTTREEAMYIVGNGSGLDDGDMVYLSTGDILCVRQGGGWLFIAFQPI